MEEAQLKSNNMLLINRDVEVDSNFFKEYNEASEFRGKLYTYKNPHKSRTFIQHGDSLLTKIGKVALGIVSLTSSLWVSAILDAIRTPDRGTISQMIDTRRDTVIDSIAEDAWRDNYIIDGRSMLDLVKEQLRLEILNRLAN